MKGIKSMVAKMMREVAGKIDAGTCEISESEAMEIMGVISHQAMSKDEAFSYLNLSRSRFDEIVRLKQLPKGRKRRGFKELVFYKDELDAAVKRMKDGKEKW